MGPNKVLRAGALLLPLLVCAQQAAGPDEVHVSSRAYVPPAYNIRVETKLVELNVAVRDAGGRVIRGLARDQFQIFDDGKEREISGFSESHAGAEMVAPTPAGPVTPAAAARVEKTAERKNAPQGATPAPRYLALFFDDVNAADGEEAGDFTRAQAAAIKLVKSALPRGTQAGVFTASGKQTLDFTADSIKLVEAITELKDHPQFSAKVCAGINPYQAYRIAQEHDQETVRMVVRATANSRCNATSNQVMTQAEEIWRRAKELSAGTFASLAHVVNYLSGKPGEHVLLMTSAGFAAGTLEADENRIIEQAVHSGVVINALVSKGLYNEMPAGERLDVDPAPQKATYTGLPGSQKWAREESAEVKERPMIMDEAMANLAHGTGGLLFHNNNDLNLGFRETSVPPEVTYRMSFKPDGVIADGSYHKLKVKLAHGGSYAVEARPGYFAPLDKAADSDTRSSLDREVTATDTLNDVPASVTTRIEKPSESQRKLSVMVKIDVGKLAFAVKDGRKTQHITFVSALLDAQGNVVTAKEGFMDLALTPETFDRLSKSGLNAGLTFQVAPGVYGLREVISDGVENKLTSSTQPLDLR